MTALLSTQQLNVDIADISVCRGLDLSIHSGQCWALIGANGTGKTTLLHTLAGLHPARSGQLLLDGEVLVGLGRRQVARRLGLLPQDSHDNFPATVWESALIGRHPHLERWNSEGVEDIAITQAALQTMGLERLQERLTSTLSGGERRRLAIATLLAQQTPLMLLDEPANHLDLRHQIAVLEHIRGLCRSARAAMMVLHDINQAAHYCDHVLMLYGNGEWEAGKIAELFNEERLSRLYGHPLRCIATPAGDVYLPGK